MKKLNVGDNVSGEITGITKYGIFVKLNDEYTGMIHISEISDRFISDIERLYVIGETIDAKVVSIDEEKKQIKLSSKEHNSVNRKRKSIKEEGRGFEPLKENLDNWVNQKLNDLEKLSKTP